MEISSIVFGITIIFNTIYMLYSFRRDDNNLYNILMYGYYDDYDDEEVIFEYSVVDDSNDIWFELL